MNSSIVLSLDTRREKADKTYPIILRLSHNGKTTGISTGYSVPETSWDEESRQIKKSYKGLENVTRINNLLVKERSKALDIIARLHDRNELDYLSITELKGLISADGNKETFFQYTEKQIKELIKLNRIGNARNYSNILREVKKFRNEVDFPFRELNYTFLKKFESYYFEKGLSENGLSVYMRGVRAILNKAIADKLVEKEAYPFDQYTIPSKPTKKRAISLSAIQKIVKLKLAPKTNLAESRNIFLISFYMMGAPFIDLAFLKKENIVDGRIQYRRRKTGKFFDIKITEKLKPILNHYIKGKEKNEYLLPIIKRTELVDQYKDIQWAQKRYNKRLKDIADKAGIQEKLTSYVSRHSFASLANNMAIPVTAISEMLGHQKLSTTQVYLAGLQKDAIDNYNESILKGL
ncbi:Site-specific recombinase XerD [Chryseolinea serpens]|uniref:Site-specific recombinase XerD n=1 Tax=Chryseolinea serpens TaxID=947013 RepID=A0A1M5XRA9_9BACT|nr:site-specific integrase [Chryseolinea serpens]SHI01803.1 Site-specific recombinase XerD [Chryseolinea serpens]